MSKKWESFCAIEPEEYPEDIPKLLSSNENHFFSRLFFQQMCARYSFPGYRRGLYMYKYFGHIYLAIDAGDIQPLGAIIIISKTEKEKLIAYTENLGLVWV